MNYLPKVNGFRVIKLQKFVILCLGIQGHPKAKFISPFESSYDILSVSNTNYAPKVNGFRVINL